MSIIPTIAESLLYKYEGINTYNIKYTEFSTFKLPQNIETKSTTQEAELKACKSNFMQSSTVMMSKESENS